MSIATSPAANLREITVGTLLDIPSNAMPPALLDPPAPAVVFETFGYRGGTTYVAAVAMEWTPFVSLRWDAHAWRVADVALWRDKGDARVAAQSLGNLLDQQADGKTVRPHVYCRVEGADRSRWRVIGPSWGGAVESAGNGRVRVYADHEPDPVGVSASFRAGVRRLAKLNLMPTARLM